MTDGRTPLDVAMDARRQELGLEWIRVAQLAGVSEQGLRNIRVGVSTPRSKTRRAIEMALQWERGSFETAQSGGTPRPSPSPAPEGQLIADATDRADLSPRRAAVQAGLTEDAWHRITTSPEHPPPIDLARAAHVVHLLPEDLERVKRPDAARELRLIRSWEQRREPSEDAGPWSDTAERAIWSMGSLTDAERTALIAQLRVRRVTDAVWPDPAEREIWDLPGLDPADRAALIVKLRVGRVTADLRAELREAKAEAEALRQATHGEQRAVG